MEEKVKNGKFRADLLDRINVLRIELPPLRERRDDIPLLTISFIIQYNLELKKKIKKIEEEALIELTSFDWPRNVRQLKSSIARMMTRCTGESLRLEDVKRAGIISELKEELETEDPSLQLENTPLQLMEKIQKGERLDSLPVLKNKYGEPLAVELAIQVVRSRKSLKVGRFFGMTDNAFRQWLVSKGWTKKKILQS